MDLNIILAGLFFVIGILTIVKNKISNTMYDLFWFCDFAPFLISIAFLIENMQLNKAIINVGFLTQLVTLVLLLSGFISGRDIIGSKKALSRGKFYVLIEILIHLPVIALLVLTYNIAPSAISLVYSLILIVLMFFFTSMFTSPKRNINLLYNVGISNRKGSEALKLPFHTALWILYVFIVSLITFLIQYILYISIAI